MTRGAMKIFDHIYRTNYWANQESVSGHGSSLDATAVVRQKLPGILRECGIRTLLDIPCGDYHWFKDVNESGEFVYIGADVVHDLIRHNRKHYPGVDFRELDITASQLPQVDLVFVRDLFGHFSNRDIKYALNNTRRSGSKYLMATTFPNHHAHVDIITGEWRPINLAEFYGLGDPVYLLNEHCTAGNGKYADKSLGLWEL